jgi:Uncharacterized protein conserved in bacteria
MSKSSPTAASVSGDPASAVARATRGRRGGSVNLRIEAETRRLIDDAATALGKTRTEFMIESARREAIDVLLDQRLFTLDAERYDAFVRALDAPPAPGPKLEALMRRIPQWDR